MTGDTDFFIAMTVVSRAELQTGIAQFARPEEEREAVQALVAAYPTYPLDGASVDRAGTIHGSLRAKGAGIGILDAMIAAVALDRREELPTRNRREFSRVDGLTVVTY